MSGVVCWIFGRRGGLVAGGRSLKCCTRNKSENLFIVSSSQEQLTGSKGLKATCPDGVAKCLLRAARDPCRSEEHAFERASLNSVNDMIATSAPTNQPAKSGGILPSFSLVIWCAKMFKSSCFATPILEELRFLGCQMLDSSVFKAILGKRRSSPGLVQGSASGLLRPPPKTMVQPE